MTGKAIMKKIKTHLYDAFFLWTYQTKSESEKTKLWSISLNSLVKRCCALISSISRHFRVRVFFFLWGEK